MYPAPPILTDYTNDPRSASPSWFLNDERGFIDERLAVDHGLRFSPPHCVRPRAPSPISYDQLSAAGSRPRGMKRARRRAVPDALGSRCEPVHDQVSQRGCLGEVSRGGRGTSISSLTNTLGWNRDTQLRRAVQDFERRWSLPRAVSLRRRKSEQTVVAAGNRWRGNRHAARGVTIT